jgi:hypothetical protein
MSPLLVLGGIVAFIGLIAYVGMVQERKRADAMQQVATVMGFSYAKDDAGAGLPPRAATLPLFDRGHSRKAKNLLGGTLADHPVTVLDYTYVTGSGKNRSIHRQTVALFSEAAGGLPDFEMVPENVFHKIGAVFGYQDIDFPEDEEFSKRYLLRGLDEPAIRGTFSSAARMLLLQSPGWSVQTRDGAVALFHAGRLWKPEELPARLADALSVLNRLGRGAT